LRTLENQQYEDIINVCWSYPHIECTIETKVVDIDKEDQFLITSNSVVTAALHLTRRPLGEFFEDETSAELVIEEKDEDAESVDAVAKPVWQKKLKKGKGTKKVAKKQQPKKKKKEELAVTAVDEQEKGKKPKKDEVENEADSDTECAGVEEIAADDEDELSNGASSDEDDSDEKKIVRKEDEDGTDADDEEDDEDIPALNNKDLIQLLEGQSKDSHVCHAPYLPLPKQEHWWAYIVEKRSNSLVTAPTLVTSLKEEEDVELRFAAPEKVGTYYYTAWLRSDVYIDFDVYQNFKIDVREAKEFDATKHWEYTSEEDDKDDSGESVYETEEDDE